ncbi:MAG TPA: hypothetical protein PK360_18345, partial [bacterium]|nr:hypothetical protein [bacterium]
MDCDGELIENTATFTTNDNGVTGSASASVQVHKKAIDLKVSKTADPSFDRSYKWKITKTADPTDLTLTCGESQDINYTVAVGLDESVNGGKGYLDSNWQVSGEITITNDSACDVLITGIVDVISPDIPATVTCASALPFTLKAGDSITCTYSAALPDGSARTNTVTVEVDGSACLDSMTETVGFEFDDEAMNEIDECVVVDDTNGEFGDKYGDPAEVCAQDFAPGEVSKTFTYTITVDGDELDCDGELIENTATFKAVDDDNDTGQTGNASASVQVNKEEIDLQVSKDANPSFKRIYKWEITKTATPSSIYLSPEIPTGEIAYDVTVENTGYDDSGWKVTGTITIKNNSACAVEITGIEDIIEPGGIEAVVSCGDDFPITLAAGGTLECNYSADLPDASARTNHVTVDVGPSAC